MESNNLKDYAANSTFFIFGDARSGTTYLANELTKRANIVIPPESNFYIELINKYKNRSLHRPEDVREFLDLVYGDEKFEDWNILRFDLESALSGLPLKVSDAVQIICRAYCHKIGRKPDAFGVKKNLIYHFKRVSEWFRNPKVIWIIRDGRAVFNSKKNSVISSTGRPFATDSKEAALEWVEKNRKLSSIKKCHCHTKLVYYEDMILNSEEVIGELCEFLCSKTLPLSSDNRNTTYMIPKRYGNKLHENVVKKADASRICAWKEGLHSSEVQRYEFYASRELTRHNYKIITRRNKIWFHLGDRVQRAHQCVRSASRFLVSIRNRLI